MSAVDNGGAPCTVQPVAARPGRTHSGVRGPPRRRQETRARTSSAARLGSSLPLTLLEGVCRGLDAQAWCSGGAEGTRTPDPLQWYTESPRLEVSRVVSTNHHLTWADALNHGRRSPPVYRRISGSLGRNRVTSELSGSPTWRTSWPRRSLPDRGGIAIPVARSRRRRRPSRHGPLRPSTPRLGGAGRAGHDPTTSGVVAPF